MCLSLSPWLDLDQDFLGFSGVFCSRHPKAAGAGGKLSAEEVGLKAVTRRSLRPWQSCAVCPARRLGLCAQLAAEEIAALAEIKQRARVVLAGSLLYRQNEPCNDYIVILVGWVSLRIALEDGSRHILDFAVPGTFFGLEPAPGALMGHSAECLTDVTVCLLPRVRFDHLVSRSITICSRLAELATSHGARAQDHLANLSGRACACTPPVPWLPAAASAASGPARSRTFADWS